jgi:putative protease
VRCAPRARASWASRPPRIRKPGEEKIDRYLDSLEPDALLVRGLGHLARFEETSERSDDRSPWLVGDFSLNVTNRVTAAEVLARASTRSRPRSISTRRS